MLDSLAAADLQCSLFPKHGVDHPNVADFPSEATRSPLRPRDEDIHCDGRAIGWCH